MKKFLLKILGGISVVLGTIGIFLPVIPTTPFLLLAAWAFLNSSDTLYNWLMNHRVFGLYIRSYVEFRGVSKFHKIFAITTLWITMIISILLIDKFPVKILLGIIAVLVTIHLLKLKTLTKTQMKELEEMRRLHQEKITSEE
ncbi:MAG: YbaN family protein [Lagierella massiliensis]|nr:YbaN family protein [Lagierella massiliensis]